MFAIAQGFGALGPDVYGGLVNSHSGLFVAYLVGASVMIVDGLVEVFIGLARAQVARACCDTALGGRRPRADRWRPEHAQDSLISVHRSTVLVKARVRRLGDTSQKGQSGRRSRSPRTTSRIGRTG